MHVESLEKMVQEIVEQARALKDKHTDQKNAPVNYACIFSQSKEEYDDLIETALKIGKVVEEMKTGLLFQIKPLDTIAGKLQLLKIRIPDVTRAERGDADFTVSNYPDFKKKYLPKNGFGLIKRREDFEMLELMDPEFHVRAYFSDPPLDKQLGIK
ncbi:MAG TPA: hypothetical protein VJA47_05870 [archaeon]|nr:hypothetical protein [archaeon]